MRRSVAARISDSKHILAVRGKMAGTVYLWSDRELSCPVRNGYDVAIRTRTCRKVDFEISLVRPQVSAL
jgi:hypothetical protein